MPEPIQEIGRRGSDSPAEDPLASHRFDALGWSYYTRVDHEDVWDRTQKLGHYAVRGDEVREIDYTPYAAMTRECFAAVVRLGFPERRLLDPHRHSGVFDIYHRERSCALYRIESALALHASLGEGMPAATVKHWLAVARQFPLDPTEEAA